MTNGSAAPFSKPPSDESSCRVTFLGNERNKKLADLIEQEHPACACEKFSVSPYSPGPISDEELVFRVIISPRDIDQNGTLKAAPFDKVAAEGLSVVRAIADAVELETLIVDGMYNKEGEERRAVQAIYFASVGGVDGIRKLGSSGGRLFGVYDQTVPKKFDPNQHVPTHAGIFLRHPSPGVTDRRRLQKDFAGLLRDLFIRNPIDLKKLHNDLIKNINDRAAQGDFEILIESES